MAEFDGTTVIITGGTSGIGLSTARRFAAMGAQVEAWGLGAAAAPATPGVTFRDCDVTDPAMTQQLAQSALADALPVAALVNAAGVMHLGTTLDLPFEDWERSLAVNMTGVLLSSRAVIPHMRRGSAVVNIASVVALAAGRRRVAYAAAKAGVIGMTRAMALDHAADGIRVNVICPGAVETPMLHGAWAAVAPQTPAESMRAALEAGTPLGRVASPEDIADLIAFLCGPQSSFITGAVIPIDGGITAQLAASQAR